MTRVVYLFRRARHIQLFSQTVWRNKKTAQINNFPLPRMWWMPSTIFSVVPDDSDYFVCVTRNILSFKNQTLIFSQRLLTMRDSKLTTAFRHRRICVQTSSGQLPQTLGGRTWYRQEPFENFVFNRRHEQLRIGRYLAALMRCEFDVTETKLIIDFSEDNHQTMTAVRNLRLVWGFSLPLPPFKWKSWLEWVLVRRLWHFKIDYTALRINS